MERGYCLGVTRLGLAVALASCAEPARHSNPASDAGSDELAVGDTDPGTGHAEVEPNNGSTPTEVNEIVPGWTMSGAIQTARDVDIFQLATTAGNVYRVHLANGSGSGLRPHLTVFDAGRGGESAGNDYVKITRGTTETDVAFLAMGVGGYLIAVQDQRNADGGSVGSAGLTYTLSVTESAAADVSSRTLAFPETFSDTLDHPGDLRVYSFTATADVDVTASLVATNSTPPTGMDGRLWVYSIATGDWVARQDDRTAEDVNPLLSAPMPASGPMFLWAENIAEQATALEYQLAVSSP